MTGFLTTTCLLVDAVFFVTRVFVTRVDLAGGAFRRVGPLPSAAFFLSLGALLDSLFLGVGFFFPTSFCFGTGLFFLASFLFGAAFFFGCAFRLGVAFVLATALLAAPERLGWLAGRFFVLRAGAKPLAFARTDFRRGVFFFDACPFRWPRAAIPLGFEVRFFFVPAFFLLARRGFDAPDRLPDLRVDFAI